MPSDHHTGRGDAIAIVGIGGLFAASDSPDRLWANVVDGTDATSEVPPDRWLIDPLEAMDPRVALPDHVYTTRGGFVGPVRFDPTGTALDPGLVERLDPVFHLALCAASQAWRDARTEAVDRLRTGVVFGNIVLPTETASALSLDLLGRRFEQRLGIPGKPASPFEPRNAFPAGLPSAIVARAFELGGVAYTLDAACGSSLYALKLAVDELKSGRADAMITGGVSRPDALYTQMGFSQLRALSPRGHATPLDQRADGLIVGEGAGMFVLKRLGDAIAQGDRIRGIIAGIGLSNDVNGDLMAPDSEGQLRAMRAAYEQAGWRPDDVDLIECHATGTPRGDAVEVASLKALWGDAGWRGGQCVIGSVKANIGHALTAAGAAGLLKILMALKNHTLPPTANFERSSPQLGLEDSPFRILTDAQPWPARHSGCPRRAAISGFGFGGINAHVLIEEWMPEPSGTRGTAFQAVGNSHGQDARATQDHGQDARATRACEPAPIAIVGLATQLGTLEGREALGGLVFGSDGRPEDRRIRSLEFPIGQFRIPPKELAEMLPQQSLMLRVAAEAIRDASWDAGLASRTGVLIGIGLDLNTTNFYLRWSLADQAERWNQDLGLDLSREKLDGWIDELREAAGPALSANRTMGSLGGVVASRIARAFRIGGPSFTVSCDETSGMQAAAIAVDWLRRGELDAAIVGAVDFAGDERAALARRQLGSREPGGADSSVCLILKRLDDARRDGDCILGVIRDIATTAVGMVGEIGKSGASTGLAAVVRTTAGLNDQILPAAVHPAQFWLRNRADGPRRATVECRNLGARETRVVLEEAPISDAPAGRQRPRLTPPTGLRRSGLFAVEGRDDAEIQARIRELVQVSRDFAGESVDTMARRWWHRHPIDPRLPRGMAIVADDLDALRNLLASHLGGDHHRSSGGSIHNPCPGAPQGVAFVYPGLGNDFEGMGRDLGVLWPDVLRRQDAENRSLRDQLAPEVWWNGELPRAFADHRIPILGQVAVGGLATDVLLELGIVPDAAIGYSMGESAALVALRAWTDRDELMSRLKSSPLFATELAGPCDAARRAWDIPTDRPVDWVAGIVPRSAEDVQSAITAAGSGRVYVLIRNTRDETAIGGERTAVREVVRALRSQMLELPAVSTVHCEIGRLVEPEYRALHDVETVPPSRIAFYSGVTGCRYAVDRGSAAEAIAAQASQPIDFPRTIESAYADGMGLFIEVGPGSSCTRLIDHILGDRPHVARSACRPDRDPFAAVLEVVADCIGHRVPVDLARLYGGDEGRAPAVVSQPQPTIRVDVGPGEFRMPPPPLRPPHPAATMVPTMNHDGAGSRIETPVPAIPTSGTLSLAGALRDAERARSEAHAAFLRLAQGTSDLIGRHLAFQLSLLEAGESIASPARSHGPAASRGPVLFDRQQCLELAIGSVAAVFGPEFAEVDKLPTRVRLPDEPLMFVDRILALEGTPRSLESGRIVTEHVIQPDAWYLDGDRVAPCVAMEAGQADLVLSGYLGVDFLTRGQSVYRLLDANVTFHRRLPVAGDVMRYDIRITKFFRQGTTILFRFEYDATVDGEPLITMRDGCAGFFTAEELAAGKGIKPGELDSRIRRQAASHRDEDLIPVSSMRLDEAAVESLRQGNLAAAFGAPFDGLDLPDAGTLPGGLIAMIRRIETLQPAGGPSGLGLIRAEADIQPGDWYMACHFVDDRVMPGTLMYECCLHALRILLMRQGWIGRRDRVAFEPVPGVANRLKCRGQITEATRRVTYEVAIKERGYRPEPYAIADALIIADGKPIVSVTDLALQLSGTGREELEGLWAACPSQGRAIR